MSAVLVEDGYGGNVNDVVVGLSQYVVRAIQAPLTGTASIRSITAFVRMQGATSISNHAWASQLLVLRAKPTAPGAAVAAWQDGYISDGFNNAPTNPLETLLKTWVRTGEFSEWRFADSEIWVNNAGVIYVALGPLLTNSNSAGNGTVRLGVNGTYDTGAIENSIKLR